MEQKHYKFSIVEFFKTLFVKKECPLCNNKLVRVKSFHFVRKGHYSVSGTNYYGSIYNIKYNLRCSSCNKDFDVNELQRLRKE